MKEKLYALNESDRRLIINLQRDMNEWRATRGRGLPDQPLPDPGSRVFIAKVVSTAGIPVAASATEPGIGQIAIRKLLWDPAPSDSTFDPDVDLTRYIRGIDGLEEDSTENYIRVCYNISTDVSWDLDDYVFVVLLANGYYVALDLPRFSREGIPGAGSGSCGCSCTPAGDVEVDGVETVSQWQVLLPTITETQLHGTIRLPTNRHTLVLNEGSTSDSVSGNVGNWYKDISDELVATYNNGDDATTATNPTGHIELDKSSGGYTTLTLNIYGTVPDGGS